jgi:hypothetical protein
MGYRPFLLLSVFVMVGRRFLLQGLGGLLVTSMVPKLVTEEATASKKAPPAESSSRQEPAAKIKSPSGTTAERSTASRLSWENDLRALLEESFSNPVFMQALADTGLGIDQSRRLIKSNLQAHQEAKLSREDLFLSNADAMARAIDVPIALLVPPILLNPSIENGLKKVAPSMPDSYRDKTASVTSYHAQTMMLSYVSEILIRNFREKFVEIFQDNYKETGEVSPASVPLNKYFKEFSKREFTEKLGKDFQALWSKIQESDDLKRVFRDKKLFLRTATDISLLTGSYMAAFGGSMGLSFVIGNIPRGGIMSRNTLHEMKQSDASEKTTGYDELRNRLLSYSFNYPALLSVYSVAESIFQKYENQIGSGFKHLAATLFYSLVYAGAMTPTQIHLERSLREDGLPQRIAKELSRKYYEPLK